MQIKDARIWRIELVKEFLDELSITPEHIQKKVDKIHKNSMIGKRFVKSFNPHKASNVDNVYIGWVTPKNEAWRILFELVEDDYPLNVRFLHILKHKDMDKLLKDLAK